jgi:hypothetical protein
VVSCSELEAALYGESWTEESFREHNEMIVDVLSASSTSEHLHVAARLASDPAERIELLERALSINPWEPILLWGAVQMCSELKSTTACPLQDWGKRLVEVDSKNTETWARIAANQYAAGDTASAFAAMQRASSAAESSMYWPESIGMLERAYAASTNLSFGQRATSAFGMVWLPQYGDIIEMCRVEAAISLEWGDACLRYGELLEVQGKTDFGFAIARAIQRETYKALGKNSQAEALQARTRTLREESALSEQAYDPAEDMLMISTPKLFAAYLADVRSKGENIARGDSRAMVRDILRRRPELGCVNEGIVMPDDIR